MKKLLDLFCKAGGASKGYHDAGFEVVGCDIDPQPRYPYQFVQGDALALLKYLIASGEIDYFDAIHASPPCQGYSNTKALHPDKEHPLLIEPVRNLLRQTGKPYIIENVPGAPLQNPVVLWGPMFGLKTFRRRLFETNPWMLAPPLGKKPKGSTTLASRSYSRFADGATHISCVGHNFDPVDGAIAMQIDWMIREELAEAIPPAYTKYLGERLLVACCHNKRMVGTKPARRAYR